MTRLALALALWACLPAMVVADRAALSAVNGYRAQQGRAPLSYSTALDRAAQAHVDDMARRGYFSHDGADGSTVGSRVAGQGYGWCVVAENIAKGQRDLAAVMQAWIASPGHRRNLRNRDVTQFALAQGAGRVWVMILAAPGC